ncbi:MAG: hypothetical protein Q4F05_05680 [bacterium]|nr:hypothetical protein [bacterium]
MLVISKIGIVVFYLAMLVSAYILVEVIYGNILYPEASLGLTSDRVAYIGIQFLLMAAFSVLIIFITVLFKQSDFSIAFGILFASGIGYLITAVMNQKLSIEGFDINHYLLVGTINRISGQSSSAVIMHALTVGILWFIVWSGLTIMVTERRDVI